MIGGSRYNKGSERLREVNAGNIQNDESNSSVNDDLFAAVAEAEKHAKQILKTGQDQYVAGIKQNVVEMVRRWLEPEGSNCFTLYGKMGCGKSFFAGYLHGQLSAEKELWDNVAFSSQQTYRDTTAVRTMLISLAHQLYVNVSACHDYFHTQKLDAATIDQLAESVLIKPFEGKQLKKKAIIIIDGLDEYPRRDCEAFLESLGRLRPRMNTRVKIFFTSRPERYICSLFPGGQDSCYHIEKNKAQSQADCARFIDAKCQGTGIHIDADMKQTLITKSEASLKYLECFFNDLAYCKMALTVDLINNLPQGLTQYYRSQLQRYFSGENLGFYQERLAPLLELLCVVSRHLTVQEAADILGCRGMELDRIISRSGTLVWKNGDYVMLYQAESVREFLTHDSSCPEDYLIDCANGHQRILDRLDEIIDNDEEIESNMYLFNYVADHILGQKRVTKQDWKRVNRILANYAHKLDLRTALFRRILDRNINEIVQFLRLMTEDSQIHPLLQATTCVRFTSIAISEKQEDKLAQLLERLESEDAFRLMYHYSQARIHLLNKRESQAHQQLTGALPVAEDRADITLWRICYLEICADVRRKQQEISRAEVTDEYIAFFQETQKLSQLCHRPNTPVQMALLRNRAVSYGQLAVLCEDLEKEKDPLLRQQCAQKLQALLQLPDIQPDDEGYFLQAATECYLQRKKLYETSRDCDTCSEARVYDLYFSCLALGSLYFNKKHPGYDPDRGVQYFQEYISQAEHIARRPESHVRYIRSLINIYSRLVKLYLAEKQYDSAQMFWEKAQELRSLRMAHQPSAEAAFNLCYGYEQKAMIIREAYGIEAAEPYYLEAVRQYQQCAEQYTEQFVQKSVPIVYHNMAVAFRNNNQPKKTLEYHRLAQEAAKRLCAISPSPELRWFWAISEDGIMMALRQMNSEDTVDEQVDRGRSALAIYEELAASDPSEPKYWSSAAYLYYNLCLVHLDHDQIPEALGCLEKAFTLFAHIAEHVPSLRKFLYIPAYLFGRISGKLTDPAVYQTHLAACKAYLTRVASYSVSADFEEQRCALLTDEAKRIRSNQGLEAAFPYHEELIRVARNAAARWKTPNLVWFEAVNHTALYIGKQQFNQPDAAREHLRKAQQILEQARAEGIESSSLQLLLARVYGWQADTLLAEAPQKTDTPGTAAETANLYATLAKAYSWKTVFQQSAPQTPEIMEEAASLYIRQLALLQSLLPENQFTTLHTDIGRAMQRLQDLGRKLEQLIAEELRHGVPRVEYLLKLLPTAIMLFECLAKQQREDAQEKLEHYKQLLAQLSGHSTT